MSNPLNPDLMTPAERLGEIAKILAAGLLRLRQREKSSNGNGLRDFRLDFPPHRSVHATTRQRRKVAR